MGMFLNRFAVPCTESFQSEPAGRRPRRFAMFLVKCQTRPLLTSSQTSAGNQLTSSLDWLLNQSTNSLTSSLTNSLTSKPSHWMDKEGSQHWTRSLQQGKQPLQSNLNSVRSWSSLPSRRPFKQFLVQD